MKKQFVIAALASVLAMSSAVAADSYKIPTIVKIAGKQPHQQEAAVDR